MNPCKVSRSRLKALTDLPNIGPAMAADLRLLGYETPLSIAGASPMAMYERLCKLTGTRHDPCVLDVFMSVTQFLAGGPPQAWWQFTNARKALLGPPTATQDT
jgi:hypothetical protein